MSAKLERPQPHENFQYTPLEQDALIDAKLRLRRAEQELWMIRKSLRSCMAPDAVIHLRAHLVSAIVSRLRWRRRCALKARREAYLSYEYALIPMRLRVDRIWRKLEELVQESLRGRLSEESFMGKILRNGEG
jgi:hypothetical protein